MEQAIQAMSVLGAAGALAWILRLLTSTPPSLHTHSEVEGLKADKVELWTANRALQKAVDDANEALADVLKLLSDRKT